MIKGQSIRLNAHRIRERRKEDRRQHPYLSKRHKGMERRLFDRRKGERSRPSQDVKGDDYND
jgi:hypothetical protein